MGAEYVIFGMDGRPVCGEGSRTDHRVIVVQNCWYDWQLKMITKMQQSGAKVLFNCDDWIKGIGRRTDSHGHADIFKKRDTLDTHFRMLSLCDGIIASTPWIAEKLYAYNPNIAIARNGIDPGRYTPWMDVVRDMGVIIGWAGGTGHRDALRAISEPVSRVVRDNPEVSLWIVGQDESDLFSCPVHRVDWSDMHLYPQQLACFDINLAPALDNDFYRGKSQLRLYEAMTLGTPSVVHPMYDEVGMAGSIARTSDQWYGILSALVHDEELRNRQRYYAIEQAKEVTIDARIGEWVTAIDQLTGERS